MTNILKLAKGLLIIFMLTGCAKAFKKPGDEPVKSPCESCKEEPFYINGRVVQ
jgi:hypothetical protein